jgi:hypothetical protein
MWIIMGSLTVFVLLGGFKKIRHRHFLYSVKHEFDVCTTYEMQNDTSDAGFDEKLIHHVIICRWKSNLGRLS